MTRSLRKKAEGFTLLELLIVVAIIGVLAAIAIPNFVSAANKAKYNRALADTKLIVSQGQLYQNDTGSYATNLAAMTPNYISGAHDPFGSGTADYQNAVNALPIHAWTVGIDGAAGTWDGTAGIGANDNVGFSSQAGCQVGTSGVTAGVRC